MISEVQASDAGKYECTAQSMAGTKTAPAAMLKVLAPPTIIRGPQDTEVVEGEGLDLPCDVSGLLWSSFFVFGFIKYLKGSHTRKSKISNGKESTQNLIATSMNRGTESHVAIVYRYKMLPFNVLFFAIPFK